MGHRQDLVSIPESNGEAFKGFKQGRSKIDDCKFGQIVSFLGLGLYQMKKELSGDLSELPVALVPGAPAVSPLALRALLTDTMVPPHGCGGAALPWPLRWSCGRWHASKAAYENSKSQYVPPHTLSPARWPAVFLIVGYWVLK